MGFNSNFSFLGIGIPELVFIIMLALVVLGPERLPTVAKDLIRAFFKLRNLSKDLTGQLENELGVAEIKELKGIKTGKLIEDWANDELDLDFDEDEEARTAAAKKKTAASKQLPAQAKGKQAATGQTQSKELAKEQSEKVDSVVERSGEAGKEGTEILSPDTPVMPEVENQDTIGSANSIGTFPGGAAPDMNGAAANELNSANAIGGPNAGEIAAASSNSICGPKGSPQHYAANGKGRSSLMDGAYSAGASPKQRYGWQEVLERRKQLRTRILGPNVKSKARRVHPSLQRSRFRKQSAAFRCKARQNVFGPVPVKSDYLQESNVALEKVPSRLR